MIINFFTEMFFEKTIKVTPISVGSGEAIKKPARLVSK